MFQDITEGPGKLSYMDHTWEILAMLLVAFLLGLLLGYILWYKWHKMYLELQAENERLKGLHLELEKNHASLRYHADEMEKDNGGLRIKVSSLEGDVIGMRTKMGKYETDLAAALAAVPAIATTSSGLQARGVADMPAVLAADDLKVVEGIGPKIEKLCNGIGIRTFDQLASASFDTLRKMLDDAGTAFRISDPTTWPRQAELAAAGNWEELKEYQKFLSGGKSPGQ